MNLYVYRKHDVQTSNVFLNELLHGLYAHHMAFVCVYLGPVVFRGSVPTLPGLEIDLLEHKSRQESVPHVYE